MTFNFLTIFPNIFNSFLDESIIKRAQKKGLVNFNIINIRDFATDKHKTVDEPPFGGGPGMIMKIEPIYKALKKIKVKKGLKTKKIVLLSPTGKQFNQKKAADFSQLKEITFICGRYEGVDARVEEFIDEKISIGPYILNGGEIAAMAIIEAVVRLCPGVIGNKESLKEETFSKNLSQKEYPQYTRPRIFKIGAKKYKTPEILLSGDHKKIEDWKKLKSGN